MRELDVESLVGHAITATSFATVGVPMPALDSHPGAPDLGANSKAAGLTTWKSEVGDEAWIENNNTQPLTYSVTAASDAQQVLTIEVQGASLASPLFIFAQVLAWNAGAILLQGFLDAGLTQPLPGKTPYFILGSSIGANGFNTSSAGNTYTVPASPQTPFSLPTIDAPSCFARGTSIATPSGARAVEDLVAGDIVLTVSGQSQAIQWIAYREIHCAAHRQPARVMPVRIEAGAFGPGLPVRDLFLSPEHAVLDGGALVPVHCLVNGATIRQMPVEHIAYYHVELARHDVVLAEGLPAESYRETGNRMAMQADARAA
jgi:hypothetical protein